MGQVATGQDQPHQVRQEAQAAHLVRGAVLSHDQADDVAEAGRDDPAGLGQ